MRRLAADYEAVRAEFSGHQYVQVVPFGPNRPPEAYRVTYRVPGLRLEGNQPVAVDRHDVEIRLPLGYPREKPLCTPVTPVFHPNIKDYYCIQDYWAAGQGLVDTIAKIADMIQFKVYNPASPLDANAARWAQQNRSLFPLGNISLGAPEVDIVIGGRKPDRPRPPAARHQELSAGWPQAPTAAPSLSGAAVEPGGQSGDWLVITLRSDERS
jgi:ubiquitin-protein ligase